MTITDAMIEAGARALCRLRIEHNHRFDKEPRDEAFKKRCEDAAWQDFVVEAKAALEAAERAASHEEPLKPLGYISAAGLRRLSRRGTGTIYPWKTDAIHTPVYTRPLPTPGEQG